MKSLISLIVLFVIIVECHGQFAIPERTNLQKHSRTVGLSHNGFVTGIAFAKKSGVKVQDYSNTIGDMFKTGWNKEAGFAGFAGGTIFNWESIRTEQDPPMEIVEQSENHVVLKWKINYKPLFANGPLYNVTLEEYTQFLDIVHQRIAAYMGATCKMEVLPDDWLKMTISRMKP
jgi:hypothetical protein